MANLRRPIAPIAVTVPPLLLPARSEDEPPPVVELTSAFEERGQRAALDVKRDVVEGSFNAQG